MNQRQGRGGRVSTTCKQEVGDILASAGIKRCAAFQSSIQQERQDVEIWGSPTDEDGSFLLFLGQSVMIFERGERTSISPVVDRQTDMAGYEAYDEASHYGFGSTARLEYPSAGD